MKNSRKEMKSFELYSDGKKAELFDKICEHYFTRNFGTMTKSEFELLLFNMLLNYLRDELPNEISDYSISNILGISQTRVRNLKQRAELVYPRVNFDKTWKDDFKNYIQYARYDEKTGLVKVNIADVTVITELRNYMEENKWYDEYQLNPKLFQCPVEIFLELCQKMDDKRIHLNETQIKNIERIKKKSNLDDKAIDLIKQGKVKEGVQKLAKTTAKEGISELLSVIPFGKTAKVFINALEKEIGGN